MAPLHADFTIKICENLLQYFIYSDNIFKHFTRARTFPMWPRLSCGLAEGLMRPAEKTNTGGTYQCQ
jgi:hypothetical protein